MLELQIPRILENILKTVLYKIHFSFSQYWPEWAAIHSGTKEDKFLHSGMCQERRFQDCPQPNLFKLYAKYYLDAHPEAETPDCPKGSRCKYWTVDVSVSFCKFKNISNILI